MEKLHDYQGFGGRLHEWRDNIKERIAQFREQNPENLVELAKSKATDQLKGNTCINQDFSHLYRPKTRLELIKISAAVMGIEFAYAAETAFVSPTLLRIGVDHQHMTLVWSLSPLVGFFLCPILGTMSDRCKLNMGRRRPFIILLSIGVLMGLILVPNGESLGYWFGDENPDFIETVLNTTSNVTHKIAPLSPHRTTASETEFGHTKPTAHPWGILFTVLGTVLLDFDADACQSPSRAFLLDVCIPEDHAKGLSTFTIMAGLGGFLGYSMGGMNWDATALGRSLGGHVKAVFAIVTVLFIICVSITISSFSEIPLWALVAPKTSKHAGSRLDGGDDNIHSYGTINDEDAYSTNPFNQTENIDFQTQAESDQAYNEYENGEMKTTAFDENLTAESEAPGVEQPTETVETLSHYLLSIVYMPHSLRMICWTNLFCWMAHVCYSLYFTDFVGEAVFLGDPKALKGTLEQILYEEGIRFGCWGMAMYSLSCACYSLVIEKLIQRFKAKNVYVGGLLFYSTGMMLMAMTRVRASVIIFSWAAGVMYSTLFTMPYLLVAHYHSMGTFDLDGGVSNPQSTAKRGLGTDIAIVSSMVFLAQFILSLCMGTIVSLSGTTTAVVSTASFLAFCGALAATQIMYLDL